MKSTTRKRILKTFGWSLLTLVFLSALLIIHILLVTKPSNTTHVNWQLSRIDFESPLDSTNSREVTKAIRSIPGIKNIHLNKEKGTLIYSYEAGSKSSLEVFNQFITKVDIPAKPFIAPSMQEATGCPAMDKTSITYRFSTFIQNTFR